MQNFSTTQATNISALAGLIILVLNHFKINIAQEEVIGVLGAIMTFAGIAMNWYNRYKKGDLTLGGFRK